MSDDKEDVSSETEREAAHAFFKAHAEWLGQSWSASPEGRKYKAEFERHVAALAAPAQAAEAGKADELDARRYRWLRDHEWKDFISEWMISQNSYGQSPDDLDAAIDAALKGDSQGGEKA